MRWCWVTKKNALKAESEVSKWAELHDNVLSPESGSGWEKEETWTESFERRKQKWNKEAGLLRHVETAGGPSRTSSDRPCADTGGRTTSITKSSRVGRQTRQAAYLRQLDIVFCSWVFSAWAPRIL